MSSFTHSPSLPAPAPTLLTHHLHRQTPNHLHSYIPNAQTISIHHASPPQSCSEHPKDCTRPHFASYSSETHHTSTSLSYALPSPGYADFQPSSPILLLFIKKFIKWFFWRQASEKDFIRRVFAVAFTDSVHSVDLAHTSKDVIMFLKKVTTILLTCLLYNPNYQVKYWGALMAACLWSSLHLSWYSFSRPDKMRSKQLCSPRNELLGNGKKSLAFPH